MKFLIVGKFVISRPDNEYIVEDAIMVKLSAKPKSVKQKVRLKVKADTGAKGNILPLRCLKQIQCIVVGKPV